MIVETGSRSLVNSNRKDQNCTTRDDKSEIMQSKRRGEKVNVGIKPGRGEGGGDSHADMTGMLDEIFKNNP